jgi:hypothetical protein
MLSCTSHSNRGEVKNGVPPPAPACIDTTRWCGGCHSRRALMLRSRLRSIGLGGCRGSFSGWRMRSAASTPRATFGAARRVGPAAIRLTRGATNWSPFISGIEGPRSAFQWQPTPWPPTPGLSVVGPQPACPCPLERRAGVCRGRPPSVHLPTHTALCPRHRAAITRG